MTWEDVPSRVQYAGTFTPSASNRVRYDGMFDVFEDVYKKNKGLFARLNRDASHDGG
jgi:hypothetical protein